MNRSTLRPWLPLVALLATVTACSGVPAPGPTASPATTGSGTPGPTSSGAAPSARPMLSGPPIGSVAPIDDASRALVTRLRSGAYTQDTTTAAMEALARAGVGTFAGPSASDPVMPLTGVTSPMRVLDWQAHALAVQTWAGSAVSGRELDDAMALPAEMQAGRPLASQLLAAYVATADSPAGAISRALMAGQDLLDTSNLRFPSLVMVFFLSDLATDGGKRAPAGAALTAMAVPPAVRTAALGSICSEAANWVTGMIDSLFQAVKLATPDNLPGAILVSIWNWLVDKAEAFVNRLIGALTDFVLAQVRLIAGAISALVQRVASFLPYGVEVRTEPRQIFVLPPSGPSPGGVLIATVSAGDLPDWPDVLKDCAGVAKVPLPDFRPAGVPVVWGKPYGGGTQFVVPGIGSPATDPNGEARWEFATLPDGAPGGDPVDGVMQQDVKIRRPEVSEARAALTSGLLGGLPPLISDLVGQLLAPFMDAVFTRLDSLVEATGSGAAVIVYHTPSEASPSPPTPAPSRGPRDVCSLLTDAEVTAVIGVPIARHESQGNLTQGSCIKGTERVAFGGSMEGISFASFSVTRGATLADLGLADSDLDWHPVSGLGDEAVFIPSVGTVFGVTDGVLFTIQVVRGGGTHNGGSYGTEAEVVGLARLLISRL